MIHNISNIYILLSRRKVDYPGTLVGVYKNKLH